MLRRLDIQVLKEGQLEELSAALDPFVSQLKLLQWDRQYLRPLLVRWEASSPVSRPRQPSGMASARSFEFPLDLNADADNPGECSSQSWVQLTDCGRVSSSSAGPSQNQHIEEGKPAC